MYRMSNIFAIFQRILIEWKVGKVLTFLLKYIVYYVIRAQLKSSFS